MSRSKSAFTLLEVMAAVAIVAIVFTTLARVASEGLRSEGMSKRRLEASLIADAALADVEAQFAAGIEPEAREEEDEDDERFTVVVEVEPFDLAAAIPLEDAEGDAGAESALLSRTGPGATTAESPLRQVRIRVIWSEGFEELEVTRTTFGIDQASIQDILGQVAANAPPVGGPGAAR